MIHTATLVHDDILDEAVVRRHAATVNAEWGNETAVLLGDYLFTHAFHLAASLESTLACRWIGRATNLVCEGEMHAGPQPRQPRPRRGRLLRDHPRQDRRADRRLLPPRGPLRRGRRRDGRGALDGYGRDLGVAFQIADDVLDLWGDERTTGKSLGTDLEKQKLTLPLIRLLAIGSPGLAARRPADDRRADRPERAARSGPIWKRPAPSIMLGSGPRTSPRAASEALDILPETAAKGSSPQHGPVCRPPPVLNQLVGRPTVDRSVLWSSSDPDDRFRTCVTR